MTQEEELRRILAGYEFLDELKEAGITLAIPPSGCRILKDVTFYRRDGEIIPVPEE